MFISLRGYSVLANLYCQWAYELYIVIALGTSFSSQRKITENGAHFVFFEVFEFLSKNGPMSGSVEPATGTAVVGRFPPSPDEMFCVWAHQDPSSEERFHVELHFSPGVKGCEEEENVPMGFGFRPASSEVCVHAL